MSIAEKFEVIADRVYEKGKQDTNDAFWDEMQNYGKRTKYSCEFASEYWNDETFKPKYDINAEGYAYGFMRTPSFTDLAALLENQGVTLDTSGASNLEGFCYNCPNLTRLPKISLIGLSTIPQLCLYANAKLTTIDELELKEDGSQTVNAYAVRGNSALTNITITGKIGQNGFSFAGSTALTADSLMSIINALYDYSGTDTTKSITLGAENLAKLSDAQKAIATEKGWTLA